MTEPQPRFYVYTLASQEGTVFYVGKGQGNRMDAHERNARNEVDTYTCRKIRKVWNSGGQIIKTKVAFFDDEDAAFEKEKELIAFYGRDTLTNLTDGGEGASGWKSSIEQEVLHPDPQDFLNEVHERLRYRPPNVNDLPPLRYAVLPLKTGYVIYDRMTHQIVDGTYAILADALDTAWSFSKYGEVPRNMTPSSAALGLFIPQRRCNTETSYVQSEPHSA